MRRSVAPFLLIGKGASEFSTNVAPRCSVTYHFGSSLSHFLLELFLVFWGEALFCSSCVSHASRKGSRGQFARSSVAHRHSGTVPNFREMATTFSPPSSCPMKVQPATPKSKVSSIQVSALGADPDFAVLGSVAEGEGELVLHHRHMCKQNLGKAPMHA